MEDKKLTKIRNNRLYKSSFKRVKKEIEGLQKALSKCQIIKPHPIVAGGRSNLNPITLNNMI